MGNLIQCRKDISFKLYLESFINLFRSHVNLISTKFLQILMNALRCLYNSIKQMLSPFTALPTLLGPRTLITHGLQRLMGCILPTMHCRSQHCWELLHPFAHHCQQCWELLRLFARSLRRRRRRKHNKFPLENSWHF